MKKYTILTANFSLLTSILFAQTPTGTIKGSIADGGNQQIIDAATISLFRAQKILPGEN